MRKLSFSAERGNVFWEKRTGRKVYGKKWIKSRDMGFYSIEYSWKKNSHQIKNQLFNKQSITFSLLQQLATSVDFPIQ